MNLRPSIDLNRSVVQPIPRADIILHQPTALFLVRQDSLEGQDQDYRAIWPLGPESGRQVWILSLLLESTFVDKMSQLDIFLIWGISATFTQDNNTNELIASTYTKFTTKSLPRWSFKYTLNIFANINLMSLLGVEPTTSIILHPILLRPNCS